MALLLTACGGKPTAGVANLGATIPTSAAPSAATTTTAATPAPTGVSSGVAGGTMRLPAGTGTAFSSCMRSHGEPNFPDPNGQGVISFSAADGVDPGSSQFQSAQQACQKLLPNIVPSPAQQAQMKTKMLAYSACMRSHGLPNFPDPTFSSGHVSLAIRSGTGIDPSSPQFQAAQSACRSDLPGLPTTAGGGSSIGVKSTGKAVASGGAG